MKKRGYVLGVMFGMAVAMTACTAKAPAETTVAAEESIEETTIEIESETEEAETAEMKELTPASEAAESKEQKTEETKAAEEKVEEKAEPAAKAVQENAGGYEDNFAVDGSASSAFGKKIKDAVADKDLEALADLTSFPVYVGFKDGGKVVESRDAFIALGADSIFTAEMLDSIAGADETALSPSMAGFVLQTGDGPNIIFGVVDGKLGIVGMNY